MSIKKYSLNFCLITLLLLTQASTANTILVTSTLDAGAGTLRAAVTAANPGDTIGFDPLIDSTQITLTSGRITLSQNIVIIGNGPAKTIIDGNQNDLVFEITAGDSVVITALVVRDGQTSGNGGGIINNGHLKLEGCHIRSNRVIANVGPAYGGGILNYGKITLQDCEIFSNSLCSIPGVAQGGGMCNFGWALIVNTTFKGNSVLAKANDQLGEGGGLYTNDTAKIISCQFSGNLTEGNAGNGGGLYTGGLSASTTMINSTVSGNKAGSITAAAAGGGIYKGDGFLSMVNCILAINQTDGNGRDIFAANAINDAGYNLIGDTTEAANQFPNSTLKGGFSNPIDPEFIDDVDDAFLPTTSGDLRLMDTSPAVNAGNPDTTGLMLPALDLAKQTRVNSIIDIGAYERCPLSWVIDASFNPVAGTYFAQDSIHLSGITILNGNALTLSAPVVAVDPVTENQLGAILNISHVGCQQ